MLLRDVLPLLPIWRLGIAPATVAAYGCTVACLDRWTGRAVTVDALTEPLLREFLAYRLRLKAPKTAKRDRATILLLWRLAYAHKLVKRRPPKIESIRVPRRLPVGFSLSEFERLLAAARAMQGDVRGTGIPRRYYWPSLLLFLYDSGSRIGEAMTLTPAAVSLAERFAVLRCSKTGVERLVNLSDQTTAAIAAHYDPRRALVWPLPCHRCRLHRTLDALLSRAGLPHDRWHKFHCLRRTSGSLVQANGGNGSAHLGNSPEVFARYYAVPTILNTSQLNRLPRPCGDAPDDWSI